jgi:NADP-dependent 3-hydroxy acid dehydrogenase YdfG
MKAPNPSFYKQLKVKMESVFNKKVVVVGATGGIGIETVRLLKSSNAQLYISSTNEAKLNHLLESVGLSVDRGFIVDITNPNQVEEMALAIGDVDILINAAGIGIIKPLEKLTYEDFNRTIDVNLKGTFHLLKSFLPAMKEQKKGLIINLPGVLGKTPIWCWSICCK